MGTGMLADWLAMCVSHLDAQGRFPAALIDIQVCMSSVYCAKSGLEVIASQRQQSHDRFGPGFSTDLVLHRLVLAAYGWCFGRRLHTRAKNVSIKPFHCDNLSFYTPKKGNLRRACS